MLLFRATSHVEVKAIQVSHCFLRLIFQCLPFVVTVAYIYINILVQLCLWVQHVRLPYHFVGQQLKSILGAPLGEHKAPTNSQLPGQNYSVFVSNVQISTVDAFQGGEKDLIILSCVRTDHIGFIDCDRWGARVLKRCQVLLRLTTCDHVIFLLNAAFCCCLPFFPLSLKNIREIYVKGLDVDGT